MVVSKAFMMFSVYEPLYLNQCGSEQGFHDVFCL